ncbi:104_t:CDS:2, partial [Dentiscutata heterogama]
RESETQVQNGKKNPSSPDITYFSIRIGQKMKVILNDREFIITIAVSYSNNPYLPGYNCQSDTLYIETPVHDPSTAISSIYTHIFNMKTRYSGPLIIGWTDHDIVSQLLAIVPFFSFFLIWANLRFLFLELGHLLKKIRVKAVQDDIYKVKVYQDSQLKKSVERISPNDVWENFSINKYNGIQLFGLDYVIT